MTDAARSVELDALLERLPSWFELVSAEGRAPTLRDQRDGGTWRWFPGGGVTIGITPALEAEVQGLLARFPEWISPIPSQLAPRVVQLAPYLMREQVAPSPEVPDEPYIVLRDYTNEARKALAPWGARLPTEAEWEAAFQIIREERGHWVWSLGELCSDGWSLDGAPGDSSPGVVRHAGFEPLTMEAVVPSRWPLKIQRLVTVRPTLSLPELGA